VVRAQSIKQHACDFGRTVPFPDSQATNSGHYCKRDNEKSSDRDLEKSQSPAHEYLQSSGHRYLRQRAGHPRYKKRSTISVQPRVFWNINCAMRLSVLDS